VQRNSEFTTYFNTWVATELGYQGAPLEPESPILEMGLLDSLQIMQLITALEEREGLSIPLEEVVEENFVTPAAVNAMVTRIKAQS
jgi:acyl carrier protein